MWYHVTRGVLVYMVGFPTGQPSVEGYALQVVKFLAGDGVSVVPFQAFTRQ